jgi:hypothetical protein
MAVIFNKNLEYNLGSFEEMRQQKIAQFWKFYNSNQWSWNRESGEPLQTINYSKAVVDIGVDFLMGNGFTIASHNEENNQVLVPLLNDIWEDNDKDLLGQEIALCGGVTGDAWIEVTWDSDLERIQINAIDSSMVFPVWNPLDKNEMLECSIIIPSWKKNSAGVDSDLFSNPHSDRVTVDNITKYTYKKVYTREKIREYHDEKLVNTWDNVIGLIPIAHIKNFPTTWEYGISDLQDVVSLNREINEKITNFSDIVNYHVAPTTIVFGSKADRLEKGSNKTWGLPKDARVENLHLQSDMPAMQVILELLKKGMYETASIPEQAFGNLQPVSNTSGVALEMMYHPIVRKTKKKRLTYSRGIIDASILILKYLTVYAGLDLSKYSNPFQLFVQYPRMLPKDEMIEQQINLEKLNAQLTSRAQVLRDTTDLSEQKIQAILKEADDDMMNKMKMQFTMQYGDSMGLPPGGSNVETDTPEGTVNKARREAANGSDGQGRPATSNS